MIWYGGGRYFFLNCIAHNSAEGKLNICQNSAQSKKLINIRIQNHSCHESIDHESFHDHWEHTFPHLDSEEISRNLSVVSEKFHSSSLRPLASSEKLFANTLWIVWLSCTQHAKNWNKIRYEILGDASICSDHSFRLLRKASSFYQIGEASHSIVIFVIHENQTHEFVNSGVHTIDAVGTKRDSSIRMNDHCDQFMELTPLLWVLYGLHIPFPYSRLNYIII